MCAFTYLIKSPKCKALKELCALKFQKIFSNNPLEKSYNFILTKIWEELVLHIYLNIIYIIRLYVCQSTRWKNIILGKSAFVFLQKDFFLCIAYILYQYLFYDPWHFIFTFSLLICGISSFVKDVLVFSPISSFKFRFCHMA